jgi:hypothetical protein
MSAVDEILSQIPMDQLASQLGVDEASAEQAARQAVPALLGGMQANAQDPGGAASLARALGEHAGGDPFEGLDLDSVDVDDGEAIVGNVFGDNRDQVVNKLGGQGGNQGMMAKLLPLLAPLVLSWLAGKFSGGQGQATRGGEGSGGGLSDLLGGAAGGGSGGGLDDLLGGGSGGGGLGDLLGGLLGGDGGSAPGGSDIGDLLGGLLGGGRKA